MSKSRLIGDYPVIGIRPTIDGRRGPLRVRESLEEQTMNMAKSAAKLISENLRYSNGEPVKVVIADTIKGKGVSFMENQVSWHGSAPNAEQYQEAMAELDAKLKELEA